jgi:hypothetical protein
MIWTEGEGPSSSAEVKRVEVIPLFTTLFLITLSAELKMEIKIFKVPVSL